MRREGLQIVVGSIRQVFVEMSVLVAAEVGE